MKGGEIPAITLENLKINKINESEPKNENLINLVNDDINSNITQNILDIDTLINIYPEHLSFIKDDSLYITPILVGELDLKFSKLNDKDFYKILSLINKRLFLFDKTSINQSDVYNTYISIIDNPENNTDIIFIINLFILMKYNFFEDFYQKNIIYPRVKKNIIKQTGGTIIKKLIGDKIIGTGGREYIETGIDIVGTFISLEAFNYIFGMKLSTSTVIATSIITQTIGMRNIISGVNKAFETSEYIGRKIAGQPIIPLNIKRLMTKTNQSISITIDTIDAYISTYKFKISEIVSDQLRKQYAKYSSRCFFESVSKISPIDYETLKQEIIEFQTNKGYLTPDFIQPTEEEEDLPIPPLNITDEQLKSFLIIQNNNLLLSTEGINELKNLYKPQRTQLKKQINKIYPNGIPDTSITQNKLAIFVNAKLDQLLGPPPQIPTSKKQVYKKFKCPSCFNEFQFFQEDGYIHQTFTNDQIEEEINERINEFKKRDREFIVTEELKTQIREEILFYNKLNILPCKQLIKSLKPEQKQLDKFKFQIEGDNIEVGEGLMCGNCVLDGLNSLSDIEWPLYIGSKADNIIITTDLVQELIENLTPNELKRIFDRKYKLHQLACVKFNQIKINREIFNTISNKIKIENPNISDAELSEKTSNEIDVIECPRCNNNNIGRFYRVFTKKDIEILYLHCNYCGYSFNGCDYQKPFLINKKEFSQFLESKNVCDFYKQALINRRTDGMVRITMELYKELKQREIINKWNDKYREINQLSFKKCPHCNTEYGIESGCSAIICKSCRGTFCYVCSQPTNPAGGGHDQSHFLMNTDFFNDPENGGAPYGGYYAVQCVNVNFSIIDPDGNPGIHRGYTQPRSATPIVPNPNFKLLTRITWKKLNYLIEKYQNLGFRNPIREIMRGGETWAKMDSIFYDPDNDVCYEKGDLIYDPDIKARNEIQTFIRRCDLNLEEPVVLAKDVKPEDIIEYLDKKEKPQAAEEQPVIEQPVLEEPAIEQPVIEEPVIEQPVLEQPQEIEDDLFALLDDEEFEINIALIEGLIHNAAPNDLNDEDLDILNNVIHDHEEEIMPRLEEIDRALEAQIEADRQFAEQIQDDENKLMDDELQLLNLLQEIQQEEQEEAKQEEVKQEEVKQEELQQIRPMPLQRENKAEIDNRQNIFEELVPREVNTIIPENFEDVDIEEQEDMINIAIQLEYDELNKQNQEKWDKLLEVAQNFYNRQQVLGDNKLQYYENGIKIIQEKKAANEHFPYDPNLILRQMISECVIKFYVEQLQFSNITHICFVYSQWSNDYLISFKHRDGSYRNLMNAFIFVNPTYAKCIEVNFDNVNKLVNSLNYEIFGGDYNISFETILYDNGYIQYLYNRIDVQEGGKNVNGSKTRIFTRRIRKYKINKNTKKYKKNIVKKSKKKIKKLIKNKNTRKNVSRKK